MEVLETNIDQLQVPNTVKIKDALRKMNENLIGLLLVTHPDGSVDGIVTAGDLRRALIADNPLDSPIESIVNRDAFMLEESVYRGRVFAELLEEKPFISEYNFIPIISQGEDAKQLFADLIITPVIFGKEELSKQLLTANKSILIKEAMRLIDRNGTGTLFLLNDHQKLVGCCTDSDIRRALFEGNDQDCSIETIMTRTPITAPCDASSEMLYRIARQAKLTGIKIPLVDNDYKVCKIAYVPWTDDVEKIQKILVIGGAGYLGSVLSRKLLLEGYKVNVIDQLYYGDASICDLKDNPSFEFFKGDMRNIETVASAIRDTDAVVLLAAIVGDPASAIEPKFTLETNAFACLSVAQICKYYQINRFLFASTCSVYGQSLDIVTEESPLNPVSLYARSKIFAEQQILSLADTNFSPTVLRMGTLYGHSPRPRFDLVVNLFTAKALKEGRISVFGGDQYRPMLHVEDAADCYVRVLQSPIEMVGGQVFNVGLENQNFTILQIAEEVKRIIADTVIDVLPQETDLRDYRVSFERIRKYIGSKPKRNLQNGIKDILSAFERGEIIRPYSDPIYSNVLSLSENGVMRETIFE